LKYFHTPSTDRVRPIFEKYLSIDITEGWVWNHFDPARAKAELNEQKGTDLFTVHIGRNTFDGRWSFDVREGA